jgi:lysophospholipase L1-like esterase
MREVIHSRGPLARAAEAVRRGKITIGFVGGSITDPQGANRWSDKLIGWFLSRFPGLQVNVENAAKGATGSASALFRVEADILDKRCDLIFWECAVNDDEPPEIRGRLREGVLRKLLAGADADVVPVYTFKQAMFEDYRAGRLPETVAELELLAAHYGLSSVNVGLYGLEAVRGGRLRWAEWLPDGLHPDHLGSAVYAERVTRLIAEACEGAAAAGTAGRASLPPPLFGADWSQARALDLDAVERVGPWRLNREYRIPTVNRILFSSSFEAGLRFSFHGTGLVVFQCVNFHSAAFRYRLDGGDWRDAPDERPDWARDAADWVRATVLVSDLAAGNHDVAFESMWGQGPNCLGTDFALCGLGILP